MAEERLPLAVAPDIDGPKARLGVAWFAVTVAAALLSQLALAVVFAAAAGLAADQVLRLRERTEGNVLVDPLRLPAVLGGAALPLAAVGGPDLVLAGVAAVTVVVLGHRVWSGPPTGSVGDVGLVLGGALPFGLAAASPVLLAEFGTSAAVVLLVLVAAYDAGDFLVGTGTATPWEGPVAGILAVLVCGFGAWTLAPLPMGGHGVLAVVAVTAVLGPFGPPAASVLVGDARRPARFIRRLDSLLLAGPVAAYTVAAVVATT